MNALRRQFFLSYGVIGSFMPLLSVFLRMEGGFGILQIGLAMALSNVPMLLSPGLITLLADRNVDSRRILGGAFVVSMTVFSLMYSVSNMWLWLVLFLFHGLAFVAMLPLQDGFYFTYAEQQRRATGKPVTPYPLVRVWGTVGFIIPSLILYFLLRGGAPTNRILLCSIGFAAVALVNTFTLPRVTPPARRDETNKPGGAADDGDRLPTRQAFQALISPQARYLCLGLALCFMASAAYYSYISIYFREIIGIPAHYIGLVINIGVVVEVGFSLWMPRLQAKLKLKGIMVAGLTCMATRMTLLALFPTLTIAVATQLLHGMEVLALYVAPVMFIDRLAGDRFRNSIQGVFTMTVGGGARVLGALIAGVVATHGLRILLGYGASLVVLALLVILFKFKRIPTPDEVKETPADPVTPQPRAETPPTPRE